MKIKTFIPIVIILLVLIIVAVWFISSNSIKTITDFHHNDPEKISKIDMLNGNNGEIISIKNKKTISDICKYMSRIKFKKFNPEPSTGWSYEFKFYENNKEMLDITFNGDTACDIDGTKYKTEKSIDMTIDTFYQEIVKSSLKQ